MKEALSLLSIGFVLGAAVVVLVAHKVVSEIQTAKSEINSALDRLLKVVQTAPAPTRPQKHAIAGTNPTPIAE